MLPFEKGPCMNSSLRYYFDSNIGKCMQFLYGSCHGNDNNFESLTECEQTCHSLISMVSASKSIDIDMSMKNKLFLNSRYSNLIFKNRSK